MPRNPDCQQCELYTKARHVCLWGEERVWKDPEEGGLMPEVMIVGEAPGYQEDVKGHVFIGPSGDLLNRAMRAVGLDRAHITNAVKCLPANHPTLPKKSVGACAPYLDEEIAEIQPQYILALGATAMQRLGGKGRITEQMGKEFWSEKYNCWIMPTLHPAAILRSPGRHDGWMADLHHFAHLVQDGQATLPPLSVIVADTVAHLSKLANLIMSRPFAYDFEATPIPWWHKDWRPYSVAFYFDYDYTGTPVAWVLPLQHPESPWNLGQWAASGALTSFFHEVKDAMCDPNRVKVTHNDLYDAPVWNRVAGYYPHTTCDTMALAHLLDENRPKSLKWLGRSLLGWPDWDIDATKEHPLSELAHYNSYDAYATWLLREKLLADLDEQPKMRRYFANIVMPSIRAVGRMTVRGIYVDPEVLAERTEQCQENISQARAAIPVENPGSRDQIADWLYNENKLPILSSTPTGKPSTDEATINLLARQFPEAKKVLEYRKWTKYQSTYLAYADELIRTSREGRAHFDYRSTSVETGRWGSRFHTQPRDPFVRSIFSACPGWTLLSADYSQIEARLAAWKAAGKPSRWEDVDPARGQMLLAFRDGRDVYVETAAAALGKDPNDITTKGPQSERQIMGKVPSLAMIYRISAKGFREYAWNQFEIAYSESEAEHLHTAFYQRWPEIAEWHRIEDKLIRARGYAENPLGRIRHLPEVQSPDRQVVEGAIRSGINAPIQGCASNILDAAHIYLDDYFRRCWLVDEPRAYIVGIVHDDLLIESRNEWFDDTAEIVHTVMTETVPRLLQHLDLHLPPGLLKVEMQAGPWGAGRDVTPA